MASLLGENTEVGVLSVGTFRGHNDVPGIAKAKLDNKTVLM